MSDICDQVDRTNIDGCASEDSSGYHGSPNETELYPLIPADWIIQRKAWPDHLKRTLREYMLAHQFFNFRSTQHESCVKLDGAVQQLQALFDQTSWDTSIHSTKLKEKVCNQIHKIRAEIEEDSKDPILEFRIVLHKLPAKSHPEAVRVMLEILGRDAVSAGLDEFDLLNFDEAGQFGAGLL